MTGLLTQYLGVGPIADRPEVPDIVPNALALWKDSLSKDVWMWERAVTQDAEEPGTWVRFSIQETPEDEGLYGRNELGEWVEIPAAGIADAPDDGKQYVRQDGAWAEVEIPEQGLEDAPEDGNLYARKDGAWESFEPGEDGGGGGEGGPLIVSQEIQLQLTNGWVNYGAPFESPKAVKIGRVVTITCILRDGNPNTSPFTLPVGWRPSGKIQTLGMAAGYACYFQINANGQAIIDNGPNSNVSADCEFNVSYIVPEADAFKPVGVAGAAPASIELDIPFLNGWYSENPAVEHRCIKTGRLVAIYAHVKGVDYNAKIFQLPEGWRPEATVRATIYEGAGQLGYAVVNPDGSVYASYVYGDPTQSAVINMVFAVPESDAHNGSTGSENGGGGSSDWLVESWGDWENGGRKFADGSIEQWGRSAGAQFEIVFPVPFVEGCQGVYFIGGPDGNPDQGVGLTFHLLALAKDRFTFRQTYQVRNDSGLAGAPFGWRAYGK